MSPLSKLSDELEAAARRAAAASQDWLTNDFAQREFEKLASPQNILALLEEQRVASHNNDIFQLAVEAVSSWLAENIKAAAMEGGRTLSGDDLIIALRKDLAVPKPKP